MKSRQDIEAEELTRLAAYACRAAESQGREYAEDEHPYRTCFQRDRDRIVHSKAFRRLEYKTQVFVYHEGDHYRTRLTHSLEVAQISRSIARTLSLNEDLAEAICLAHDLGHPPFGHSGQDVINELMKGEGGFEHNRQSLRIVTVLEQRYPNFDGLNLSFEVLEGISKHFTEYDLPEGRGFQREGRPSLEAQVANLSDEIAYNHHDLDDGLRSGMINLKQLSKITLWEEAFTEVKNDFVSAKESLLISQTIRRLINRVVTDLVGQTFSNLQQNSVKTLKEVREATKNLVEHSKPIQSQITELKRFLYNHLYKLYRVERMADKAERILTDLFNAYVKNPKILPTDVYLKAKKAGGKRVICDYIAGMTDRYALDEHEKLFNPHAKV